jgi:aminoglycoside phosphotransferase (APT) family kinase protein
VEWLEERREKVPCEVPSITHNDFHGFNIMLDKNENAYVIDWGAARVTDSRYDLAWTLLLYFAYGDIDRRDALLEGYEAAAGESVDQIEFFECCACLRRLHDISSSISKGAEELGMRPEAVQMMRESVDHIINVRDRLKDLTGLVIPSIDSMIEEISQ